MSRRIATRVLVCLPLLAMVVFLPSTVVCSAEIGFVVDPGGFIDSNFDVFWEDRLESQGHSVIGIGADEAASDYPDVDFFYISNDVGSGDVVANFGLEDEPRTVITNEWGLYDDIGFSDNGSGDRPEGTSIDIEDANHPLAAGLTGTVEIYSDFQGITRVIGDLAPEMDIVASFDDGADSFPAIAVLEVGAENWLGDPSPGRRIATFSHDGGDGFLYTDIGLALLDANVDYALGIDGLTKLQAGDADMDLDFDQLDLVKVQIAGKYLTGQAATWGEGDWNGAPGGEPGNPPAGNGMFDQLDIISALAANVYLTGPYGAIAKGGDEMDEQTSLVYDVATGELKVDAPASTDLTSINITSAGSQFIGDKPAVLDGAFDNFGPDNIFKATFGGSFGDISFGNVLAAGLSEDEVATDLSAVGSLAGGGDLGPVDLVYVPEPSSIAMLFLAVVVMLSRRSMP